VIKFETCGSQLVRDEVRAGSAQPGHKDRVNMLEPWHTEGVEFPRVNILPTSIMKAATTDSGVFAEKAKLPATSSAAATISTTHSFAKAGTYFVTIKVESERNGDASSPYAHIPNLARVRVVVR
jgi:hypothetical protein